MSSPWRTEARQERSRATQRRIVAAAAELLGKHGFEALPVAAVARRARVSVGGLDARFADKQALVHAVDEWMVQELDAELAASMDPVKLADRNVAGVIEAYVVAMVGFFARRRDLLREIVLRARSSGDPCFLERVRAFNRRAHGWKIEVAEQGGVIRSVDARTELTAQRGSDGVLEVRIDGESARHYAPVAMGGVGAAEAESLAGTWHGAEIEADVSLVAEDGKLRIDANSTSNPIAPFLAVDRDTWVSDSGMQIDVKRAADGKPDSLRLSTARARGVSLTRR